MSHFLSRGKGVPRECTLDRPRAAVRVRVETRKRLVVEPDIFVLKPGTAIAPLPPEVEIHAPDGEKIEATGSFWVSTETIDPVHAVIDLF